MLVEDDKSLREIYGVRLQAEGYEIKSAGDGEEALAMAIKEHPDLIIADVMMPKISGFDMLDILRATPETKDIKVIMMTALSSEDQRTRGETLGADRYLVKSQVGIEDVVRTIHDVLGDAPVITKPIQQFTQPIPTINIPVSAPVANPIPTPVQPIIQPTAVPTPNPVIMPQPIAPFSMPAMTPSTPVTVQPSNIPTPETVVQPVYEPQSTTTQPVILEPTMQPQPMTPTPAANPTISMTPDISTLMSEEIRKENTANNAGPSL